jgi:hypothetical protein
MFSLKMRISVVVIEGAAQLLVEHFAPQTTPTSDLPGSRTRPYS